MIKLGIALIIGIIIGKFYSYYTNRVQCINCGSYNTYLASAGYGGVKGSKCNFAVKHWEGHRCNKCGKGISIQMEIINYE